MAITSLGFLQSDYLKAGGFPAQVRNYCGLDASQDGRTLIVRSLNPDMFPATNSSGYASSGTSDAAHDATQTGLIIRGESSVPADNDTVSLVFEHVNDATDVETWIGAQLDVVAKDVSNGSEDALAILKLMDGGSLVEASRIEPPSRIALEWIAGRRGKPGLNADIQNAAEATRMVADPEFELLGTNASSDDCTYNAEGGITIQTDGADNDQVILLPHLDTNQSAWTQVTWGSDQETRWEATIVTGSSIAAEIVWAGLKLTNTPTTATDDDQVFFRYQNGVNSGAWQAIYSIGGTDTAGDSGVTVAASTVYRFVIDIDASRVARMYINETLVATSTALTTAKDFIPYIGVQASGAAAAKDITIRNQRISRKYA